MNLSKPNKTPDGAPQLVSGLNPFADDVFLGGVTGIVDGANTTVPGSVDTLNAAAIARLESDLSSLTTGSVGAATAASRVVLLLAPRAGFGKSHLLANIGRSVADRATVVPLSFDRETPARWTHVIPQVVKSLERREGASLGGELTGLDFVARHVFATASRQLVHTGLVPCADPVKAEALLARDAMGLFDFADGSQPVAAWFQDTFEKLLSPAGREIALFAGIAPERISYWMRALFSYAEGYADATVRRTETLRWVLTNPADAPANPSGMELTTVGRSSDRELDAKTKVLDLCRLATLWRPLVFVIDHLDSIHEDRAAGRAVATLVADLQQNVPGALTVVSSNQDVWRSAFDEGLPSALHDRLTGNIVQLGGTDRESAEELVRSRLAGSGASDEDAGGFLEFLQLSNFFEARGGEAVSARAVLRYASDRWGKFIGQPGSGPKPAQATSPGLVGNFLFPEEGIDKTPDAFPTLDAGASDIAAAESPQNVFDPIPVIEPELRGSIQESIQGLSEDGGFGDVGSGPPAEEKPLRPLGDLKGMIDRFRSDRDSPNPDAGIGVSESFSGPADADIQESQTPASALPGVLKAPPPLPAQPAEGIAGAGVPGRFAGARTRWAGMNGALSTIDHSKFRHLISVAGNRFPVVRCEEIEIPGFAETPVVRWTFGDTEVYFGFQPAGDSAFWRALGEFVIPRSSRLLAGGSNEPWKKAKIKIVHFDTESGAGAVPDLGSESGVLDTVVFDRSAVASVYAAEEIVRDAEAGTIDADPGSVLGVLARELDFLWKRLTRPV